MGVANISNIFCFCFLEYLKFLIFFFFFFFFGGGGKW